MEAFFSGLESSLDRLGRALMAWWVWPAFLAVVGWTALIGALLATPVGEDVRFLGLDPFGPCDFQARTGQPCASCGMTRSWMWAVRGDVARSLRYNAAGTVMFASFVALGLVATVRLALQRPGFLAPGWRAGIVGVLGWFALYLGGWGARLAGWVPLP